MIGVLEYSEAVDPEKHGLYFMDTPGKTLTPSPVWLQAEHRLFFYYR